MDVTRRIATLILDADSFCADDVTNDGEDAIDPSRKPNGRQSAIGGAFTGLTRQGLIVTDGRTVISRSRYRHHGRILLWRGTPEGAAWAKDLLGR